VQLELGGIYLDVGDWERASRILTDALAFAERGEFVEGIRVAQRLLAELDLLAERPARARQRLEPLLDRSGFEEMQVTELLPALAEAQAACGDAARAEATIQEAIRRTTAANALLVLAQSLVVRGRLRAAQGDLPAAERDFAEALRLACEMSCPYLEARALFSRAISYRNHGHREQARTDLNAARPIFARLGARPFLEWTEQALATL
jgi:tetratricopeptide (TPR) repeat protein